MTAIQQAEQAGFDMSLIKESLRLTYEERALQHQEALNLALALERAGQLLRTKEQDASAGSATGLRSLSLSKCSGR